MNEDAYEEIRTMLIETLLDEPAFRSYDDNEVEQIVSEIMVDIREIVNECT